jgi:hypothetical protein
VGCKGTREEKSEEMSLQISGASTWQGTFDLVLMVIGRGGRRGNLDGDPGQASHRGNRQNVEAGSVDSEPISDVEPICTKLCPSCWRWR